MRCWRALERRDLDEAVAAVLRVSHAANRIPSSVLLGNVHCPMHVAALLAPAIDDLLTGALLPCAPVWQVIHQSAGTRTCVLVE